MLRTNRMYLVDVTLREGEQFAGAYFTTEQKIAIAQKLDEFGADYIEVTSPACSPQSWEDARILSSLGLKAKIAAHVRCTKADIDKSLEAGVQVIHMMYATSKILQQYSHGKNIDQIIDAAVAMTEYVKDQGYEVRFSGEDGTRTTLRDLEKVYDSVVDAGIDRIGCPDTTGIATPHHIAHIFSTFKERYNIAMEFHGHNDTGCAIANSYTALYHGCTHIDVSVLGIGERNGITPIGGLIARLYPFDRDLIEQYQLKTIVELDRMVAEYLNLTIPFNNYFSSTNAFYHTAGIHTNAILRNPESYEIFNLDDFGITRTLEVGHRLIGKNVIEALGKSMNLEYTREEYLQITADLKALTDKGRLTEKEVRDYIKKWGKRQSK